MFQFLGSRSLFNEEDSQPANNVFEDYFRCYPISMMPKHLNKEKYNYGGKIFLPPSALQKLMNLQIRYPMLFELLNESAHKITHCGVLEFIAEEGRAYVPNWMMKSLKLKPGGLIKINNTDLPLGTFVKIEPQSVDFIEDISDPKAILEAQFRNFATLTVDDIIEIEYIDKVYRIKVLEVKPCEDIEYNGGICIIETDLVTDFAPPKGYVENFSKDEQNKDKKDQSKDKVSTVKIKGEMSKRLNYDQLLLQNEKEMKNIAFKGQGVSLSGRKNDFDKCDPPIEKLSISNNNKNINIDKVNEEKIKNMIKNNDNILPLRLPPNQLFFGFPVVPPVLDKNDHVEKEGQNVRFQGSGSSLRSKKRKRKVKASSNIDASSNKTKKKKTTKGTIDDPMQID